MLDNVVQSNKCRRKCLYAYAFLIYTFYFRTHPRSMKTLFSVESIDMIPQHTILARMLSIHTSHVKIIIFWMRQIKNLKFPQPVWSIGQSLGQGQDSADLSLQNHKSEIKYCAILCLTFFSMLTNRAHISYKITKRI